MPSPPLTPRPRSSHHKAAPAIPANPVPDDHAPSAVREDACVGKVVVIWRKVSSPKPDESDASEIPKRRGYREADSAIVCQDSARTGTDATEDILTMMPSQLAMVQNATRRTYWILPREMRGHATFV